MKTSDSIKNILPALFKVKSEIKELSKGAENPYFNSSYADLNTHLDGIEPALAKHDLMVLQPVQRDESGDYVETIVYHSSGEWVSSSMSLQTVADMQKAGSAVTYARRYTLGALFSVKTVDDDGNAASGKAVEYKAKPKQQWQKKKPTEEKLLKEEPKAFTREQAKKSNGSGDLLL